MSERPTHTQASSAMEPAAQRPHERGSASSRSADAPGREQGGYRAPSPPTTGQSLATRAARFRNGAPFLVERATLYDPYPLDPLPVIEVKTLPRRRSRPLLPVALTLLGVVVVVGLAAGVLFVRNADGPRHGEQAGRAVPSVAPSARTGPQGGIPYDLTRRPNDAITGAWRLSRELEKQVESTPEPPVRVAEPPPSATPPVAEAPRRLLPRHLSIPRVSAEKEIAEPSELPRAPLDEPHLPKAVTEVVPEIGVQDEPRAVVDADSARSPSAHAPEEQAPQQAESERSGGSVVARVRREAEEPEPEPRRRRSGMPVRANSETRDARKSRSGKSGGLSRWALLEQQRRMRKAAREAQDLDRFLLRDKGDIPKGFDFAGPQGQRP